MKVSFRVGRYLLALLWHWSLPFTFGAIAASAVALQGIQDSVELIDQSLGASITRVAESCKAQPDPPPKTQSAPVSGAGLPAAGTGGETG